MNIYHLTTNGHDRLCGITGGLAIHATYAGRELDVGEWCMKCEMERILRARGEVMFECPASLETSARASIERALVYGFAMEGVKTYVYPGPNVGVTSVGGVLPEQVQLAELIVQEALAWLQPEG